MPFEKNKRFKIAIDIRGDFNCTYVFQSEKQKDKWIKEELPKLEEKYGTLKTNTRKIDTPLIGEKCFVVGEGDEIFTVMDIFQYNDKNQRYGCQLDSGWSEEVHKCLRLKKEK